MDREEKKAALAPFALMAEKKLHELEPMVKEGTHLVLMLVTPGKPTAAFLMTHAPLEAVQEAVDYFMDGGDHEVSKAELIAAREAKGG